MFSIQYIEKSSIHPNGQIFAKLFEEVEWIYREDEFPFLFEIWQDKKLKWSCSLYSNCWASWDCLESKNLEAFIKGSDGKIISHFVHNPWVNRNSTEQFFSTWIDKNPGSMGIVIGTHDGTSGEWVESIRGKKSKAVLVEASEDLYNELVFNYNGFENVKFRNEIITSDGRETEFYEFGPGHANTINKEHYEKHVFDFDNVKIEKKNSLSINDLIFQENMEKNLDWIHLDTESIDDEIIMALDFDKIIKPKLIVFETINFSEERTGNRDRIDKLFNWLSDNGYKVKYDFWNSFAYLG